MVDEKVSEGFQKTFGKKALPKFPCKISMSKFGALHIEVYVNAKYARKVLGV